MKTKIVRGSVSEKWGIKFPKVLKFDGPVPGGLYETHAEIVAANDLPNNDKVVQFTNASRVANTRSKLTAARIAAEAEAFAKENAAALAAGSIVNPYIEPTPENNPDLRWYGMFDSVMSNKKHTREQACELTVTVMGFGPPSDFDEHTDEESA